MSKVKKLIVLGLICFFFTWLIEFLAWHFDSEFFYLWLMARIDVSPSMLLHPLTILGLALLMATLFVRDHPRTESLLKNLVELEEG